MNSMANRTKYAIFICGEQVTDFDLTKRQAERLAKTFEDEGSTDVEVVERELKLEETEEYWR